MGVSRTMMFPEGFSKRLSSGGEDDDAVTQSFHSMAVGFPWLEEFGVQGPTEVGQWWRMVVSIADRLFLERRSDLCEDHQASS